MPARFRKADLRGKKNFGARFAPGANAAKIREFFANSRRCRRDLLWLAVASREGGWSRNRNHFRGFATLVCLRFVVFIFVSAFSDKEGILRGSLTRFRSADLVAQTRARSPT